MSLIHNKEPLSNGSPGGSTKSFSVLQGRAGKKPGSSFFPAGFGLVTSKSAQSVPAASTGRGLNFLKQPKAVASCINFAMGRGRGSLIKDAPQISGAISSVSVEDHAIEVSPTAAVEEAVPDKFSDLPLPVHKVREEIIAAIRKTQVTIITGATGSGKVIIPNCVMKLFIICFLQTTQVPQFILEDAEKRGQPCNIIVSQPRKIAAISIAKRVAMERGSVLGEEVGYQVGLSKKVDTEEHSTRLLFCTTGVILQKVINEKDIHHYTHVVLDEVHDREIDLDLLVTIIKELMIHVSNDTKIVLMSATLDVKKFFEYFTFKQDCTPAVIEINVDRVFKIRKYYNEEIGLSESDINYERPGISAGVYRKAKELIEDRLKLSSGSILVFLPGIYEITSMNAILRNEKDLADQCLICVLHSSLSFSDQQIAFKAASKPKIILSTNIAESSVTIGGIDCVIDFCLTKYLESDKKSATAGLRVHWASQNSLEQRAGRTGRTCNGVVYRLVNRRFFDRLPVQTSPEMERVPLETTVLRVKLLDVEPPISLLQKTMDPPKRELIIRAIMILKELGGLERLDAENDFTHENGNLTYIGRIMAVLPLDVRLSKLIVMGYIFSLFDETITIAAGLNIKGIFRNRYGRELDDYVRKLEYADGSGCDSVAILNAYRKWKLMREQGHFKDWQEEKRWCEKFHLERKSLHEMLQMIEEIRERLIEVQLDSLKGEFSTSWTETEKPFVLKICLAATFIPNFFIYGTSSLENEDRIHREIGWKDPYNSVYLKCRDKGLFLEAYVEQIKDEIVKAGMCNHVDNVKVSVDQGSSKIFVEFVNDEIDDVREGYKALGTLTPGYAAPEVYKALRIGEQSGFKLRIKVMDDSDLCRYIEELGILDDRRGIKKMYYKQPADVAIPATCVPSLPGIVTHVKNCSKFWMQPMTELNKKNLEKIGEDLEKVAKFPIRNTIELKMSDLLVVKHSDKLKRAKVISVDSKNQMVKCFIYDFGPTEALPIEQVFKVKDKSVFDMPQLCFEASLSEIRPSAIKCPRGKWTAEAVQEFIRRVGGHECQIDVYSVLDDIASVSLSVGEENVNKSMVAMGYAQECEESFPRKDSHFDRIKNQSSDNHWFNAKDEFQQRVDKIATIPVPHPPMRSCTKFLNLNGPLSPMRCKVNPILTKGSSPCSVHPQSVNTVLLYDNPGNSYGCLLVAANCTTTRSETILHETTLMPNLPGLPVLLAMMFAPEVVFKRNDDKTRFEYIKFGLGCSTSRRFAFFPEHDASLPVNIELNEEDFDDINQLRFYMSYLLMTEPGEKVPGLKKEEKFEMLTGAKKFLMKIVSKKRRILSHAVEPTSEDWLVECQADAVVYNEQLHKGGGHYHQLNFPLLQKIDRVKAEKLLKEVEKVKSDYT